MNPTKDEVAALRRATGMPLLMCRDLLRDATPEMREKLLRAARTQQGRSWLYDPIEDDPALASAIEDASREAQRLVDEQVACDRARLREQGKDHLDFMLRYTCHVYWGHVKRLLKERHGIDWLTPAEMNPGSRFD